MSSEPGQPVPSRLDEALAASDQKAFTPTEIDAALEAIPADTPKQELLAALKPVLRLLAESDSIVREEYLASIKSKYNVKLSTLRSILKDFAPPRTDFKGSVKDDGTEYLTYGPIGPVAISSFVIAPKEIVKVDGKTLVVGDIYGRSGHVMRGVCFPETAWHSRRDFIKCLPSHEYQWTGSDDNVQGVLRHLSEVPDVKHKDGTRLVGYVEIKAGSRWVAIDTVISAGGVNVDDDILYVGNSSPTSLARRLRYRQIDQTALKKLARAALPNLLALNDQSLVLVVIGWFVASLFKPRILKELGAFPILFVWGTKGAGKTSLVKLMWRIFGVAQTQPYSVTNTMFPLYELLSSTTTVPVFLDEYKPRDMGSKTVDQIHRLLRRIYDGDVEQRGRPDLSVVSYPLLAPVVVAGESRPEGDAALLERLLAVSPNRHQLDATSAYRDVYRGLRELPLEDLAVPFIQFAFTRDVKADLERAATQTSRLIKEVPGGDSVPSRNRNNLTVMVFGVTMFQKFAATLGVALPEIDLTRAIATAVEGIVDGDRGSKDAFDELLEALSIYARQDKLVEGTHYAYMSGYLCLDLASCHEVYLAERRKTGRDDDTNGLPALKRLISEKIARHSYVKKKDHRVDLGGVHPRTIALAVEEIPDSLSFEPFPKNKERVHGGRRVAGVIGGETIVPTQPPSRQPGEDDEEPPVSTLPNLLTAPVSRSLGCVAEATGDGLRLDTRY